MPNELSGGMRKRAGFARALVLDPAIVMFDEPDSGLDPVRTALLCELIREVHEENGGCYMVISHDLGTARRIADFIAVLWKGRIVESGPSDELFDSDNEFVAPVPQRRDRGPAGDGLTRVAARSVAVPDRLRREGRRPAAFAGDASPGTDRRAGGGAADAGRSSRPSLLALIGACRRRCGSRPDAGTDSLVDNGSSTYRRPRTSTSSSATSRSWSWSRAISASCC